MSGLFKSKYLIVSFIVLASIAFAFVFTQKQPLPELKELMPESRRCEQEGGIWRRWSYWQKSPECDRPYSDGGKTCTDSKDCLSELCVYEAEENVDPETKVDKAAQGTCAAWHSMSCVKHYYFVESGKVVKHVCIE